MVTMAACTPEGGLVGKRSILLRDGVFRSHISQQALMFTFDAVWDILDRGIK